MSFGLNRIARRQRAVVEAATRQASNAERIYAGANPVQQDLIDDDSRYIGGLCPRRSGKSFSVTSKVLHHAEKFPGSRILIISLTLKSTVENYWSGSPGGLWAQNSRYDLNIKFNTTQHTWVHENGSRGLLAGAETKADIEHLRGAAAEADIVVIDECKSFAPAHLLDLIENVVEPGLMTRDGQLIMIGTPGSLPMGPFYEATCTRARSGDPADPDTLRATCVPWRERNQLLKDVAEGKTLPQIYQIHNEEGELDLGSLYSLHTWTIQDNIAVPGQWKRAIWIKQRRGWADDHPTWRREYLGEWISDTADLVYAYMQARAAAMADPNNPQVNWDPDLELDQVTGLNPAMGPWHLLMGLDIGFVDASAVVVVAWSEQLKQLYHVMDFKKSGLDAQAFTEIVLAVIDRYGMPEMIVGDFGSGGGKMILETLNQRYGLAIQQAERRFKNDFIDLLNGDFISGRVRIIPDSDLERELCALQWDLSNDAKVTLARTGRLREDPSCENHLCDALLYIWRFAYHFFSNLHELGPAPGTPEWQQLQEDLEIQRLIARRAGNAGKRNDPFGLKKIADKERGEWRNRLNVA